MFIFGHLQEIINVESFYTTLYW